MTFVNNAKPQRNLGESDEGFGMHACYLSKTTYLDDCIGTSLLHCFTYLFGTNIRFGLQL